MHMISKSFLPLSLSVSLSVCQTSNKSQSLPLTSDAKQNSFGNAARIPVWLLPMARERTLGVSGSSPAWHISLSNAMASAEGVDIIPKLKHSVFVPTAQQTRDGNDSVMDGWGDGGGRLIVSEEVQKVFEFMLKKERKVYLHGLFLFTSPGVTKRTFIWCDIWIRLIFTRCLIVQARQR